jgi:hypothetical protein
MKMAAKKTSTPKKTSAKKSSSKKTVGGKLDYKIAFPELYYASSDVEPITVPTMNFFMVDGKGNPNSPEFQDVMSLLYGVSYTLKMGLKKKGGKEYVVPPLEGLWYMYNMAEWSMDTKEKWEYTMMIRVPDFITQQQVKDAMQTFKDKKNPPGFERLYYKTYIEGLSVQILHIGPYDAEPPTIQKMHRYAKENGYVLDGKHHEIYLGDPRRTAPEKLKTVLRQPVRKN